MPGEFVCYGPFMGVTTTDTNVEDARETARAWLISQGATDAEVTEMYADYPYATEEPVWWLDAPTSQTEIWGVVYEGYPDAFPVWVVLLPQGWYFTHPNVIRWDAAP